MHDAWVLIFSVGGAGTFLYLFAHAIEKALELVHDIGGFDA